MDARHFDALVKGLTAADTRRRFLTSLATLPMLAGLLGLLSPDETAAKDRRRRRKQRHRRRKNPGSRKRKNRKKCRPQSVAQTCNGKCGSVTNNCRKPVDCGSCACDPPCGACFVCQDQGTNAPGVCVVDPARLGETCGYPGQICLANGTCACDAGTCTFPQTCGGGRVVGACGCTPTTCVSLGQCGAFDDGCDQELQCDCPGGGFCCEGTCQPCPCGQEQLSNGTCVKRCATVADCGPADGTNCGCFLTPGICGTATTGIPCPNGDVDCPSGQFCNTFSGSLRCALPCNV